MGSTSAVTGPRTTGPRGAVRVPVIDVVGSSNRVGEEPPEMIKPDEEIPAWVMLEDVPGPALRKPPSTLPPITTALAASGLPPRVLKRLVPISEIWPTLMKEPPEDVGQVKPEGRPVSLAQEWMPPRVCTPTRPAPTPDRPD